METKYFDYDMCKKCGGQCCTHCAGSYIPQDFKTEITDDFIVDLLKTGKFAIDWWDGDAKGLGVLGSTHYIRPRHVNEPAIKGSWGGTCVNWSKTDGCSLKEEDRPFQCRKLVPSEYNGLPGEYDCTTKKEDKATKQDCAIAWYDYQQKIRCAMVKYRNL